MNQTNAIKVWFSSFFPCYTDSDTRHSSFSIYVLYYDFVFEFFIFEFYKCMLPSILTNLVRFLCFFFLSSIWCICIMYTYIWTCTILNDSGVQCSIVGIVNSCIIFEFVFFICFVFFFLLQQNIKAMRNRDEMLSSQQPASSRYLGSGSGSGSFSLIVIQRFMMQ